MECRCAGPGPLGWRTLLLSVLALGGACVWLVNDTRPAEPEPTALDLYRRQAEAGDPGSMVVVGYLLSTGQGTTPDLAAARRWFRRAGEFGHRVGPLNLAILLYLGAGGEPQPAAARREFRRGEPALSSVGLEHIRDVEDLVAHACRRNMEPDRGREVFLIFCSGCHGAAGVAVYAPAPSFAFGQRLYKNPRALLSSVMRGHAGMPRWDDKLPTQWLQAAVGHARTLPRRFSRGLLQAGDLPDWYFRFGPMARGVTEEPPTDGPSAAVPDPPTIREACARFGG